MDKRLIVFVINHTAIAINRFALKCGRYKIKVKEMFWISKEKIISFAHTVASVLDNVNEVRTL